MIIVDFNKVFD